MVTQQKPSPCFTTILCVFFAFQATWIWMLVVGTTSMKHLMQQDACKVVGLWWPVHPTLYWSFLCYFFSRRFQGTKTRFFFAKQQKTRKRGGSLGEADQRENIQGPNWSSVGVAMFPWSVQKNRFPMYQYSPVGLLWELPGFSGETSRLEDVKFGATGFLPSQISWANTRFCWHALNK